MKINGPDNLNINNILGENASKSRPTKSSETGASQPTADLSPKNADYREYIQKVPATDEIDLQAVARAKELIQSGQLDTPEAIERAAEKILELGI